MIWKKKDKTIVRLTRFFSPPLKWTWTFLDEASPSAAHKDIIPLCMQRFEGLQQDRRHPERRPGSLCCCDIQPQTGGREAIAPRVLCANERKEDRMKAREPQNTSFFFNEVIHHRKTKKLCRHMGDWTVQYETMKQFHRVSVGLPRTWTSGTSTESHTTPCE